MGRLNVELGIEGVESHLEATRWHTMGTLLRQNARIHEESVAVVGEDDEELTYGALNDRVNSLANALLDLGYGYGTTLAIISENRPAFVETLYTGAKLGGVVAAINWRLEQEELLHCLRIAETDVVIITGSHDEKREWIANANELNPEVVTLDGWGDDTEYESLIERGSAEEPPTVEEVSPEDGLAILYTSGTTGRPKGAVISHRAFLTRAEMRIATSEHSIEAPDFVAWAPMFHMSGTESLFVSGILGGTFYPIDGFETAVVVERCQESRTRRLPIVPSLIERVLEYADENDMAPEDFPHLKYIGAMPDLAAPDRIAEITELFGAKFVNSFGATETGPAPASRDAIPVGHTPTEGDLSKVESVLCDVRLVDEDWEPVATGEIGEIAMRGPSLFSGYVNNPEATQEVFDDGWYRSGDLFVRKEDGTLDFVDRKKYLIKSGGENIYPAEIENELMRHEAIDEAVAVRVTDNRWGEVPKVYVVTKDEAIDGDAVVDYLDGRIARYKLPHYVEFVESDEFPRSTTGKVKRREVEDWTVDDDNRVRSP